MSIVARQPLPPFSPQQLEAIARVLADTNTGLTGPEIGYLLGHCKIPDATPEMTKWKRLFNAFVEFQNQHQVGNHVVKFINEAMNPARHTRAPETFRLWREDLNPVLALCGMELGDDGKVRRVAKAETLDEAVARSNRLQSVLRQRNVHADVLDYCRAEIVAQNYFHAVFEAMKSITAKVRQLSGLTGDGARLVVGAFGQRNNSAPRLAINHLSTETECGEQRGFTSLLIGLYGTIRNPLAHEPKVEWDMTEQDALDILTMISLIHRKLDRAKPHGAATAAARGGR